MAIEQAIFTSCRTGIERSTSGFQLYSYSCSMKNILDHTSAGGLIAYEPPTEGLPLQPTVEQARRSYPRKFAYSVVEKSRGMVCFASNTYLGKDYDEDSNRYGNYICHLVSCKDVELTTYPLAYMDSPLLRTNFTLEEATSNAKPEQLPRVQVLESGTKITYESICEFLAEEGRIECVKFMLLSLLRYEQSPLPKKLLLCDEPERIPYWIGAVTMALPLQVAKTVSFSCYEYDPLSSPCQIVGTYREGTKYDTLLGKEREDFYLFDFCHGIYSDFTKEEASLIQDEFFEVVELSYGISKECMERFHTFLEGYRYKGANLEILDGYHLYLFFDSFHREDYHVLESFTKEMVAGMFSFAKTYMTESTRREFMNDMVHLIKQTTCKNDLVIKEATLFLVEQVEEKKVVKERVVAPLSMKFYYVLDTYQGDQESFLLFYEDMRESFRRMNVDLASYLFLNISKTKMVDTITQSACDWIGNFFLEVLMENIKQEQRNPECLEEDNKQGAILKAIVMKSMSVNLNKRSAVVKQYMERFQFDLRYMTYVSTYMEKWLLEGEESKVYVTLVRREYEKYFLQLSKVQRYHVYKLLQSMRQYKRMVGLIGILFEQWKRFSSWFMEVKEFITAFRQMEDSCLDALYELSFENALRDREHVYSNMLELFDYASEQNYKNSYRNTLVPYITGNLPIVASEQRDKYIINKLYESQKSILHKKIDVRVALGHLYNCLEERVNELPKITKLYELYEHRINITSLETEELHVYLEAVALHLGTLLYYTLEVPLLKDLFVMTEKQQQTLLEETLVPIIKLGKKYRNYEPLVKVYFYAISLGMDLKEGISAGMRAYGVKKKDVDALIKEHRMDWLDARYRGIAIEELCGF